MCKVTGKFAMLIVLVIGIVIGMAILVAQWLDEDGKRALTVAM